jgi:hypothetical protein
MKFRLYALIFFLLFTITSCSLSEDITPPPGYQSPTLVPTTGSPTQISQPTLTLEPTTVTPESNSTESFSTTPAENLATTPSASLGKISGKLINGSGGSIPEGQKVTLVGFDKDQSGNYQKAIVLETPVEPDGSYRFKEVEVPIERAFLVVTSLGGVEYQSDPVFVTATAKDFFIPFTIYEKTNDPNILTFNQVHLLFDSSLQDKLQVTELFIVTNPSNQVVVVSSDGTSIPFIHTPRTASSVKYQLSQGSAQLLNAMDGFAMLPGADKQYGFIATFTMPYSKILKFDQLFSLPVSSLTIFVPVGIRLRGEQFTDAGTQDIQGKSYQIYQANNMASGSSLSLTLSDKLGGSNGFKLDRQTMILIGIGLIGILLVFVGIYLYLHDRSRYKRDNEVIEEQIKIDALGEDRDNIMDAIIVLDDQYTASEISKEAYTTRRAELKERLKGVL